MTSIKTEGAIGSEPHAKYEATRLPPRAPILILDVGCGIRKQPGAIGIDRNPASQPDVLVDLDKFPYPFPDNSFDRITAIHVIEHLSDVIRSMEEFHRLLRPGGTLRIETPRKWLGFEFLVNHFARYRRFWEHYLCYIVRGKAMEFEFAAEK